MDLEAKLGSRAGKYILRRLLGAGGMGAVYLAEHELIASKKRAVKVLLPEYTRDPMMLQRFYNEAVAASQLEDKSSHIVRVEDIGTQDDGTAYITMEFLQGVSLERYLADRGRLTVHDAFRIVAQIAVGLEVAHAAGIVHRDLKPANIFITATDDNPTFPKILDFGISKLQDAATGSGMQTAVGTVMGTPAYMPPESFEDVSKADARSDVFALAAIMCQLITGRLPFDVSPDAGFRAFYFAQQTQRPQRPADISPALFDAVTVGLAFYADERPGSARDYALGIASQLAAQPPFEMSGAEIVAAWAPRLNQSRDAETVRNQSIDADRLAVLFPPPGPYPSPPIASPPPASAPLVSASRPPTARSGPRTPAVPMPMTPVQAIPSAAPAAGWTTLSAASGAVPVAEPPPPRSRWLVASAAVLALGAAGVAIVVLVNRNGAADAGTPTVAAGSSAPAPSRSPSPASSPNAALLVAPPSVTTDAAPANPTGTVTIETVPPGASLVVDGAEIGKTPQTFTRPVGARVELRLQLKGYRSATREIVIKAGAAGYNYDLDRRSEDASASRKPSTTTVRPTEPGPGSAAQAGSAKAPGSTSRKPIKLDPDGVGGD